VDFHARAAGIGEDDLDALAFEGFHENVAPEHGRADFGARFGEAGFFLFAWFQLFCSCFLSVCGWQSRIKQKTHDRCQPWVLVKFSFNKRQRRRQLRRRPE
jgi:hypothetical protein